MREKELTFHGSQHVAARLNGTIVALDVDEDIVLEMKPWEAVRLASDILRAAAYARRAEEEANR